MWASWLGQSSVGALTQTLQFTEKRHELISSNVANMDTPDYQTRDIDVKAFQAELREAIENGEQVKSGSPGEMAALKEKDADQFGKVRDITKQIKYHDGHDVSLEEQVTEAAKNQSMHNTAVALLKSQFRALQMAITENVNV
jgi:flagellar basal-body rod protein FlgB